MNEEEKKTIKYFYNLRALIDERNMLYDEGIGKEYGKEKVRQITIILNLIEKLQKENQELKEYIVIAPNLDEMTAIKYRNIRRDAYLQGRGEEQQKAEQIINENYIPIQKVKDKIEELEKAYENSKDENGESIYYYPDYAINILQELIEESEEK